MHQILRKDDIDEKDFRIGITEIHLIIEHYHYRFHYMHQVHKKNIPQTMGKIFFIEESMETIQKLTKLMRLDNFAKSIRTFAEHNRKQLKKELAHEIADLFFTLYCVIFEESLEYQIKNELQTVFDENKTRFKFKD